MGGKQSIINKDDAETLLTIVTGLMRSIGVTTWLDCGTLLGAVRDKDFIDYDTDVDIAAYSTDYVKARKETNDPEFLRSLGLRRFRVSADKYHKQILSFELICKSKTYIDVYFWNWLPSLTRIEFLGNKYNVPNNPRKYLEFLYPDYTTPRMGAGCSSKLHKYDIKHSEYYARNVVMSCFTNKF